MRMNQDVEPKERDPDDDFASAGSRYSTEKADDQTWEDKLSASEALFGFAGWLTSRKEPVTFSWRHNAAIAADLIDKYCGVNNLAEPRPGWDLLLVYPDGEKAISDNVVQGGC